MIQIFIGSMMLSLVHAALPSHWLPIVALGKSEQWVRRESLLVTAVAGTAHTLSTIIVGIIIGIVGYRLSSHQELTARFIAPFVLIIFGVVYLILDLRKGRHHHHHHAVGIKSTARRSKLTIIISLSIAMFFSPCLEIDAYFFTGGTYGHLGIIVIALVYLIVTVSGMLLLVELGSRGVEKIKSDFLEHHQRKMTALILIVLGVFSYFVQA